MRILLITLLFSAQAHAGEWKRTSPDTITFSGEITKDDAVRFGEIYRSTDKTLVLTSTGGLNEPALAIAGTLIKNRKLETVVRGVCASSCANYLFLAGKTRKIEGGVVGYHGSVRAYLESEKFRDDLRDTGVPKWNLIVPQCGHEYASLRNVSENQCRRPGSSCEGYKIDWYGISKRDATTRTISAAVSSKARSVTSNTGQRRLALNSCEMYSISA